MAFDKARTLNCYELRTFILLSMRGRLRNELVYFNNFCGLILIGFDPFWFLILIHKLGVPSLLLFIKNKLLAKVTGSKKIIKGC